MGDRRVCKDRRARLVDRRQDADTREQFNAILANKPTGSFDGYDRAWRFGIRQGLRAWKEVARRSSE